MLKFSNKLIKTTRPDTKGLNRSWYVLDASKQPMGRLSTIAAQILTGKNRADYSPDVDMGGVVVIINAKKIVVTGEKMKRRYYFRHTGRPGSLKSIALEDQMKKDFKVPFRLAISRMLPKNKQRDNRINNRLYIFAGENHNLTQKLILAN